MQGEVGLMQQLKNQSGNEFAFRESSCYEPGMDQPQTSIIYKTKPVQELID